ncbi:MAG: hypothetical protein WCC60_13290 [Ilumatobacteraceae bacterium]
MKRQGQGLTVVVALVALAACSGSGSNGMPGSEGTDFVRSTITVASTDAAPAETDVAEPEDVEELLDTVADDVVFDPAQAYLDADGVLTLDGAKALFSAAFVPLPGVEPAPDGAIHEATTVLQTLEHHRSELTSEQLAVFDGVVAAGEAIDVDDVPPGAGAHRGVGTDRLLQELSAAVREARTYFATKLGRTLPFPIKVVALPAEIAGTRMFGAETLADAQLTSDASGEFCRVRVNTSKYDSRFRLFVMAHEAFHCFQFAVNDGDPGPNWVIEGTAEWAAEEYTGGANDLAAGWSNEWVISPTRPIQLRTYDAVGLYALVDELGVPMYGYVDDLLSAPRIATVRAAAGQRLDVEWALSYAGRPSWGPPYALTAGSFRGLGARRQVLRAVRDGGPVAFPSPATSRESGAQVYALAADGDVLVISGNGFGGIQFEGADQMDFTGGFAADFCLKVGGCACPNGSSTGGGGREIVGQGSRSVFVGWGPMGDASPSLEVQSLEQWCNVASLPTSSVPGQADGCITGRWTATRLNIPPAGDQPPLVGGEGMTVEFRIDGTFIANYDTMQPAFAWLDEKNNIGMETQFTGVVPGTWTVDEAGQFVGTGDTSAMRVIARLTGPAEQEVLNVSVNDLMASLGATADPVGVYHVAECAGSAMKITTTYAGGTLSIELQRSS